MAKAADVRPLVSDDVELGLETFGNGEDPPGYFEVVEGCSDALEMTSIPWSDAPPSYGSLYPGTQDDLVEMRINGESFLVRGRVGLTPWNVTPEASVAPEQIIRRDTSYNRIPETPSPTGASGGVVWRALKVNGKPVTVSGRALAVQGDLRRGKDMDDKIHFIYTCVFTLKFAWCIQPRLLWRAYLMLNHCPWDMFEMLNT